jgi:hypothetical protein
MLYIRCYHGFDIYGTQGEFDRFNAYFYGECAAKMGKRNLQMAINVTAANFLINTQAFSDQDDTKNLAL